MMEYNKITFENDSCEICVKLIVNDPVLNNKVTAYINELNKIISKATKEIKQNADI